MDLCKTCKFYTTPFFKPKCNRISNFHVVKKKNIPFTLEESFKICKGYFFEKKNSDTSSDVNTP